MSELVTLCQLVGRVIFFVFFFKQKTAYEMRISDWSSDVCSSDLGTLYGRNSTAGVVNPITRGPSDSFDGYVQADYGSYDRFRAEGAVSVPLTDRIGLRVALLTDQGGGFMDGKGAGPATGMQLRPELPPLSAPGARDNYGDQIG